MKNIYFQATLVMISGALITSCSNESKDSNTSEGVTKSQVVQNYADIVYQNYSDAYNDAVALETAINTFTATPTDANFTIAKNKWKDARESYGTTEAFRFANGPIDHEDEDGTGPDESGPEGLLNAWPLDENYVDYVIQPGGTGGIIADASITIDKQTLSDLNENGGEKNISVGYHAIEFLLWGQDSTAPSDNLPGQRAYTDYVIGAGGTGGNQARRADYLKVCADLLTDNLAFLVDQWKVGGDYRNEFLSLPTDEALKNIYLGITTLSLEELSTERMDVALVGEDQEDEHSCFSDNTHRDIYTNLKGIVNVYKGEYGTISGASLEDLVQQTGNAAYTDTQTSLEASLTKVAAIRTPFDIAISGGPTSIEGAKVRVAVLQIKDFGSNLLAGAESIGIQVNN